MVISGLVKLKAIIFFLILLPFIFQTSTQYERILLANRGWSVGVGVTTQRYDLPVSSKPFKPYFKKSIVHLLAGLNLIWVKKKEEEEGVKGKNCCCTPGHCSAASCPFTDTPSRGLLLSVSSQEDFRAVLGVQWHWRVVPCSEEGRRSKGTFYLNYFYLFHWWNTQFRWGFHCGTVIRSSM